MIPYHIAKILTNLPPKEARCVRLYIEGLQQMEDDDETDEVPHCQACNGTGEGTVEGLACRVCKGKGF